MFWKIILRQTQLNRRLVVVVVACVYNAMGQLEQLASRLDPFSSGNITTNFKLFVREFVATFLVFVVNALSSVVLPAGEG